MSLLNRANLFAAKAASKDATRPALNSLRVTPEFTEATDGHILIRVGLPHYAPDTIEEFPEQLGKPTPPDKEVLLTPKAAADLGKKIPRNASGLFSYAALDCADANGSVPTWTTKQGEHPILRTIPTVEGPYPNSNQLFELALQKKYRRMFFSAELLKRLFSALAEMHPNRLTHMVAIDLPLEDSHAPMMVSTVGNAEQHISALVMPLRAGKHNESAPDRTPVPGLDETNLKFKKGVVK